MQYLTQFVIIMGFTLTGEALQRFLPLPIPASVWGLCLMLLALSRGLIRVEQVKTVGGFLVSILPVLFVSPTVGILDSWDIVGPVLPYLFLLSVGSTILAFAAGGRMTQWILRKGGQTP